MSSPTERPDVEANEPTTGPRAKRGLHPLWHLVIALIVLALVQGFVVKLYAVPSASMEPTLQTGDHILANRLAYLTDEPKSGDVIVFAADETWGPNPTDGDSALEFGLKWVGGFLGIGPGTDHVMTKRVLAVGGQVIECCGSDGAILVDGEAFPEFGGGDFPFGPSALDCSSEPSSQRCFEPIVVPEGAIAVIGDNRSNSVDSIYGCRGPNSIEECLITVDPDDVIGEVILVVTPLSRFGSVA